MRRPHPAASVLDCIRILVAGALPRARRSRRRATIWVRIAACVR